MGRQVGMAKRSVHVVALVACLVLAAAAVAEEDPTQNAELAALHEAQATVMSAQKDLDNVSEDANDDMMEEDAAAAHSKKKSGKKHQMLGEADDLMKLDDKTGNPEVDSDAAVEAEAMSNNVLGEGMAEGEDAAKPADVKKVFSLAKSLQPTDLLPEGWEEKHDSASGKPYYENMMTKTTTWDPPKSLVSIAMAAAKGQLHAEEQMKQMRMQMSQRDLGESVDVSETAKCPAKLKKILASAEKLKNTIRDFAAKLNLTGEQQKLLDKLMKDAVIPLLLDAKPAAKNPAAKNPAAKKPAAKKPAAKKPAANTQNDLGESQSTSKPLTLKQEKALEANDEKMAQLVAVCPLLGPITMLGFTHYLPFVQANAVKREADKVAAKFKQQQNAEELAIRKAFNDAGKAIEEKLAKEDAALMQSDKETEQSMTDIIGDKDQYEAEQGLLQGTLSPNQVQSLIDPKTAKMEKDHDFDPIKKLTKPTVKPGKPVPTPMEDEDEDEEFA